MKFFDEVQRQQIIDTLNRSIKEEIEDVSRAIRLFPEEVAKDEDSFVFTFLYTLHFNHVDWAESLLKYVKPHLYNDLLAHCLSDHIFNDNIRSFLIKRNVKVRNKKFSSLAYSLLSTPVRYDIFNELNEYSKRKYIPSLLLDYVFLATTQFADKDVVTLEALKFILSFDKIDVNYGQCEIRKWLGKMNLEHMAYIMENTQMEKKLTNGLLYNTHNIDNLKYILKFKKHHFKALDIALGKAVSDSRYDCAMLLIEYGANYNNIKGYYKTNSAHFERYVKLRELNTQ